MPKAMPETRKLVETLYLQGVQPKIISAKCNVTQNTISTWAKRHGWTVARNKAQEIGKKDYLEAQSERVRSIVGERIELLANATSKLGKPRGVQGIKEQADMVNSLVSPASKVFGWGDQANQAGAFAVGVLSGMVSGTIRPPQDDPTSTGPVIDVPSQDVPDEDESNLSGICQDNQSGDTDSLASE